MYLVIHAARKAKTQPELADKVLLIARPPLDERVFNPQFLLNINYGLIESI